jgi:hypothetical protein
MAAEDVALQSIGGFKFTNEGGFFAAGIILFKPVGDIGPPAPSSRWAWLFSPQWSCMTDLREKGVPWVGDWIIQLAILVRGGDDRTTGQYFRCSPGSSYYADFSITGAAWNSQVHYHGIGQNCKPLHDHHH